MVQALVVRVANTIGVELWLAGVLVGPFVVCAAEEPRVTIIMAVAVGALREANTFAIVAASTSTLGIALAVTTRVQLLSHAQG